MRLWDNQDGSDPDAKEDIFGIKDMAILHRRSLDDDLTSDGIDKATDGHHPRKGTEEDTSIVGSRDFRHVCQNGGTETTASHTGEQLGKEIDTPVLGDQCTDGRLWVSYAYVGVKGH